MVSVSQGNHKINGLVAATFCPFTADGAVDYARIPKYVDLLHNHGVIGVFINGSTGEGISLSTKERKLVAEAWVEHGKGKLKHLIVHVGSCNLTETKDLAQHAVSIGATGVACVPPFYFKVTALEGIVDFLAQVAESCKDLPFYYYHFPDMTAVRHSAISIFESLAPRAPNLAGMKFTAANIQDACAVGNMNQGKFQCLVGFDDLYLSSLANGLGSGAIGAFYNILPKVALRIKDAFERGDLASARLEQDRIHRTERINMKYTTGLVCREFMEFIGFDIGPPRSPLTSIPKQRKEEMRKELEDIGFFEWIK